jgi:prepilin-type N-terminal cleavage/methylation domain-containing protein
MKHKKGFTLIELIIVIVILGILAALAFISYLGAQARVRDSRRKTDMQTIAGALTLYHAEKKTWLLPNTPDTVGYIAQGKGFFYIKGSAYTKSMFNYLKSNNYLTGEVRDPFCPQSQAQDDDANKICNSHPDYMLFTSSTEATAYAQLENATDDEKAAAKLGYGYYDVMPVPPSTVGICNNLNGYPCTDLSPISPMNYGVRIP